MLRKSVLGVLSLALLILAGCSGSGAGSGSVKPYPLAVCLVTDNALGSMGDPVTLIYEGQEVKFCCRPCVQKFQADPAKFLAKLPRK